MAIGRRTRCAVRARAAGQVRSGDLEDLLSSGEIAMLSLDAAVRVRWLSAAMRASFGVTDADRGRSLAECALAAADGELVADARAVLETRTSVQREFALPDGRWVLRRVLPCGRGGPGSQGAVVTLTDITQARREVAAAIEAQRAQTEALERCMAERNAQLRAMAFELAMAEQRERRALAQDLHDDIGQVLAIARLKLGAIDKGQLAAPLQSGLREIDALIEQADRSARTLTFQLSPPVLYELGLTPAIEWLAEEFKRRYGLSVEVRDDGAAKPIAEPIRVMLFRAVRELLINVARHAGVESANVQLRREGANVVIRVEDHGDGFDWQAALTQPGGGFGLHSVRERLDFVGGAVDIRSNPGDGTSITLSAPMAQEMRP